LVPLPFFIPPTASQSPSSGTGRGRSTKWTQSHPTAIWFHTGTYLIPWSWALFEKPPVAQLLKNFPTFYGTRRLITVFTKALQWSLSWAKSIQSIPPHPISLSLPPLVTTAWHVIRSRMEETPSRYGG
jgi:hypothetical protein